MKKSKKILKLIKKQSGKEYDAKETSMSYVKEDYHNDIFNDLMFTEGSNEINEKSRNLITRLLQFRDKLSFTSTDKTVRITSGSFKLSKRSTKNTSSNLVSKVAYDSFDEFSIEIIKDIGLLINYKSDRAAFRDKEIYNDVIEEMKVSFKELNIKNFNNLYTELMKDSGLARESNLDDLLGD